MSSPSSASPIPDPDSDNASRISDEVSALRAIYGDGAVSFHARTGAIQVAFALEHDASLAMILPPGYPSRAAPRAPTLRGRGLSAAHARRIVHEALRGTGDAGGLEGGDTEESWRECVYDYCHAVAERLENELARQGVVEYAAEEAAGAVGGSGGSRDRRRFGTDVLHGEPLVDRKSTFQAHACHVRDVAAVFEFVEYLNSFGKVASATHNVMAYRVGAAQDFDDDGEHAAGKGLLFTLQQMQVDQVVVVVSRWFGGTKLGPVRFKHINNVARNLLADADWPPETGEDS